MVQKSILFILIVSGTLGAEAVILSAYCKLGGWLSLA